MDSEQAGRYLSRIGWKGQLPEINLSSLKKLMKAQLTHIPYENIDVYDLEQVPELEETAMYQKIVENCRGGYCFEVNGLFYHLLVLLGYPVYPVGVRVMWNKTVFQPVLHMGMIVSLNQEKYYCDVGYGGPGPKEPMLLKEGELVQQGNKMKVMQQKNSSALCRKNYPAETTDEFLRAPADYLVCGWHDGKWKPVLQFTDTPYCEKDFETLNFFCAKSMEVKFGKVRILTISTEAGNVSMLNETFTIRENGKTETYTCTSAAEAAYVMKEHFGICIDSKQLKW